MKILFLVLCYVLLLTGCKENTTEVLLDTYQQRLANVLKITPAETSRLNLPALPAARSLKQPVADIRIGLLNAYKLRQCGLFQLIAERNSILGKVQDQTRQLRYELLFLKQLNHCLNVIDSSDPLQSQLSDIYHQKQQQLPRVIWNMAFTSQEWRQQFTLGHQVLEQQQFSGYIENLAAFDYLATLTTAVTSTNMSPALATLTTKNIDLLLFHQQQIHNKHYIGQLFYSMAHITAVLNSITTQLNQHEKTVLCGKNINNQQALYLRNVFYKYYVTDIQPYLSTLKSQYQQLQPYLHRFYTTLVKYHIQPPSAMTLYADDYFDGDLQHQFQQAILDHVAYWQRLFERCQFKVGHQ